MKGFPFNRAAGKGEIIKKALQRKKDALFAAQRRYNITISEKKAGESRRDKGCGAESAAAAR